jgi:anion transporter
LTVEEAGKATVTPADVSRGGRSQAGDSRRGPVAMDLAIRTVALMAMALAGGSALVGVQPGLWQAAVISVATTVLWATGALPEDQTALAFFISASVLGLVGSDVVFAGFTTAALWLVFGGLVIGAAVRKTGLDRVIAAPIIATACGSYRRAVASVVLLSLVLSVMVPSNMTRMMLIVPVIVALAEGLGLSAGRGRTGLVTAAVLANYYFGTGLLPANVPNMALAGNLEKTLGIHLQFASYFITYFPVLGLLKAVLAGILIGLAFQSPVSGEAARVQTVRSAPDWRRRLTAIVLVVALLFWITDFIHGISPAWVALAAAFIFMFPGIDIVPLGELGQQASVRPLLYVGGMLGLGSFIAASGLGSAAAQELASWIGLRSDGTMREAVLLTGISATLGLLATHGGMAALMPSLAQELATASGLSLNAVIGMIVVGYSIFLLPYQVPPSVVGFQIAEIPHRSAVLATLWIGAVTAAVTVPLQFVWWNAIGFSF